MFLVGIDADFSTLHKAHPSRQYLTCLKVQHGSVHPDQPNVPPALVILRCCCYYDADATNSRYN